MKYTTGFFGNAVSVGSVFAVAGLLAANAPADNAMAQSVSGGGTATTHMSSQSVSGAHTPAPSGGINISGGTTVTAPPPASGGAAISGGVTTVNPPAAGSGSPADSTTSGGSGKDKKKGGSGGGGHVSGAEKRKMLSNEEAGGLILDSAPAELEPEQAIDGKKSQENIQISETAVKEPDAKTPESKPAKSRLLDKYGREHVIVYINTGPDGTFRLASADRSVVHIGLRNIKSIAMLELMEWDLHVAVTTEDGISIDGFVHRRMPITFHTPGGGAASLPIEEIKLIEINRPGKKGLAG